MNKKFSIYNEKGKCDTCKEQKGLDIMIKKKKGRYECTDCLVSRETILPSVDNRIIDYVYTDIENFQKIRTAFKWCMG